MIGQTNAFADKQHYYIIPSMYSKSGTYSNVLSGKGLVTPFSAGATTPTDYELYIFGGTDSTSTSKYYTYTPYTQLISNGDLPYAFYQGSAVEFRGQPTILGGAKGPRLHYTLKLSGLTWVSASTLPYDFIDGAAVTYNNEIHILGGGTAESGTRKNHYKWDGYNWTNVSTLPMDVTFNCAVVYNDEIHILSGTKHYKWDGTSWTSASTLPYNFIDGSPTVFDNEIHIFGGLSNATKHYKWNKFKWVQEQDIPYDFIKGSAVAYEDYIALFGVSNPNDPLSIIVYTHTKTHYEMKLPYGSKVLSDNITNITPSENIIKESDSFTILKDNLSVEFDVNYLDPVTVIKGREILYTTIIKEPSVSLNMPYEFTLGNAVTLGSDIYIMGGGSNGNQNFYRWNGKIWAQLDNLPYALADGCAVAYKGEIHILGGSRNGTKHYKWDGTSWTSASTLPYNFIDGSAVVYKNEIHIIGGAGGVTYHYKWNGISWVSVSTLPYRFYYGCAVVYHNEIHILGGYESAVYTNHYKWDGVLWSKVSTLPYRFYKGSAIVFKDHIYIYGGEYKGNLGEQYACYYLDGTTWQYSNEEKCPYNFYSGQIVVCGDQRYILGGGVTATQKYMYRYEDYIENKWMTTNSPFAIQLNKNMNVNGYTSKTNYKKYFASKSVYIKF